MEETRKVPPDPRLLEAAGRDVSASRVMAPESHLLQVIRRGAEIRGTPSEARLDSGSPETPAASQETPQPALPQTSSSPPEDTAFLMEAALQGGRSRLAVLLLADACLLLVGGYLIYSWSTQATRRSPEPPPREMSGKGYISWEDDGQRGSIATGPVVATFHGKGFRLPGARGSGPTPEEHPREAPSRETSPREAPSRETSPREAPSRETSPREAPSRETSPREAPAREAPAREALEAAERLRVHAARDRFLKEIPGKVRGHQKEIRRCYQQILTLRKGVWGDVDVEFELSGSGAVLRARPGRNTTGSEALGSCVAGIFHRMRFSPPPGGPVVLRYPFRFSPQHR